MTSTSAVALCQFCKKPPGTKVGPPAMVKCLTMGCEGANLAAVTVAEWNSPSTPAPTAAGALADAEAAFEFIRLKLINHVEDGPERLAFWRAVMARDAIRLARNSAPQETRGDEPVAGPILQIGGGGSGMGWGRNLIEVRESTGGESWAWRPITEDENRYLIDAMNLRTSGKCILIDCRCFEGPPCPHYALAAPQPSPRLEREGVEAAVRETLKHLDRTAAAPLSNYTFDTWVKTILALLSPDTTVVSSTERCECIGGSTYNDGTQRRCDLCGKPVPPVSSKDRGAE